jgi:hypothetical protein
MGCGAFKNDPKIMGSTMDKMNKMFDGLYENIVFVVPPTTTWYYF